MYDAHDATQTSIDQEQPAFYTRTKPKGNSCLSGFYVIENGVISFSLKSLTTFITMFTSLWLIYIFVANLQGQYLPMSLDKPRYISELIALPMWDRITCLAWTFFFFSVRVGNSRMVFKTLYGIAQPSECDKALILDCLSGIFLIGISFFDCENFGHVHLFFSVAFFFASVIQCFYYSYVFKKY